MTLKYLLLVSAFGLSSCLNFGQLGQKYRWREHCLVSKQATISSDVIITSYDCGTDSRNYEMQTASMYFFDEETNVLFIAPPSAYRMIESDGTYSVYIDEETDGWNGNERLVEESDSDTNGFSS